MSKTVDEGAVVQSIGSGRFQVTERGRSRLAYAISSPSHTWVFDEGRVWMLERHPSAQSRPGGQQAEPSLAAPMPATVARVHVSPGQQVATGDLLVTLEAMKMELAITAPRDGTVTAVRCAAGELVRAGVPLVELE